MVMQSQEVDTAETGKRTGLIPNVKPCLASGDNVLARAAIPKLAVLAAAECEDWPTG
jgi:hypothetical protein